MRTTALLGSLVCLFLSNCGGTPAEAIRPKDQTYAGAMGESGGGGACHDVEAYGEPLVVDWKPEQRGDLEVLMKDGVAVVAYSCKGLKLLKDCKVDGKYGFLGMTKKEQLVRLQNGDEVKANLPFAGAGIAANIGGEMERGATLDVALILIGKKKTTWAKVAMDDLKGDCDGATHFVKGATVGAFVMETGSKAQARTAAQLFGAGVSGSSASAKNVRNQDGDPGDCNKSSPDSPAPPSQCQALVRLELKSIAPKAAGEAAAKPAPEPPKAFVVEAAEEPCPKGMVYTDGKCTEPKNAAAFLCDPANGKECVEQCGKGHVGSCGAAGALYASGGGGLSRDENQARDLLQKACDANDAKSCVNLGVLLHQGRARTPLPAAAKAFEKGCQNGESKGCGLLGKMVLTGTGVAPDATRATTLFRQGCDGGDDASCGELGKMLLDGNGVAKDPAKAAELLKRACDGSQAAACVDLGVMTETGNGAPKNPMIAKFLYQRACTRGDFLGCANQGRLELGQGGSRDNAKRAFEQACDFKQIAVACAANKVLFNGNRPFVPDPAETNELMSRCNAGSARDCATIGTINIAMGNKPMGQGQIERACIQNEPLACAVKNKK